MLEVYSLIIGILRAADGENKLPKTFCIGITGLFIILAYQISNPLLVLVTIGLLYLGLAPGWGKYLTATGLGIYKESEKESYIVDLILTKVPTQKDVVGMSLRWFIYFIPLFVFLNNPFVIGLLAVGPIYWIHRIHKKWFITEFSSGALLGTLLFLPLIIT